MGIGATFYDDRFILRTQAIHWFWEGLVWLMTPCEKSRMTLEGLQIRCLMHYLRHTANVGCDLTWIGAGSLVRTAMCMGMHHDPELLAKMPHHRVEMRRRIWYTILEICLQSSIDSGGPPMISLEDYDTKPPSNLNDVQLDERHDSSQQLPRDAITYTGMTVALLLSNTFATRLAVAKRVNELRSDTAYENTLEYSNKLSHSLQGMMQQLESHTEITPFQARYVQGTNYRLLFALHHPILPLAASNPMYYYSRAVCVDTALRLGAISFIYDQRNDSSGLVGPDFRRLTINGAGSYRSFPLQSAMVICLELINQKEAEVNNLPTLPYSGLGLHLLASFADWSRNRILSGETNIKSYAIGALLKTYVEALDLRATRDEMEKYFEVSCEARVRECLQLLSDLAGDNATEVATNDADHDTGLYLDFELGLFGNWNGDSIDSIF